MTTLTITLDDEQARRLEERARAAGGSAEQLLARVAADLAGDADGVPLPPQVLAEAKRRAAKPLGGEQEARAALREIAGRYGLDLDAAPAEPPHP